MYSNVENIKKHLDRSYIVLIYSKFSLIFSSAKTLKSANNQPMVNEWHYPNITPPHKTKPEYKVVPTILDESNPNS